jgi:hypothetical protein
MEARKGSEGRKDGREGNNGRMGYIREGRKIMERWPNKREE